MESLEPPTGEELLLTIRLTGQAADRVRHIADVKELPAERIAADCVSDELDRDWYDALYAHRNHYGPALEGLARRLTDLVQELAALPSGDAATIVALAVAEGSGRLPDPWHERMVQQLAQTWSGRTTEFGPRPNGSIGPLENTAVSTTVTPAQWDALARIGTPGSISDGARQAMSAGIAALDR
jgi:hypothetical protein